MILIRNKTCQYLKSTPISGRIRNILTSSGRVGKKLPEKHFVSILGGQGIRQYSQNADVFNRDLPVYKNPHTSFGKVAAVFGCSGFVGRYVVAQLGKEGYQVIIPWRRDEFDIRELKLCGDVGQIVQMRYHPDFPSTIADICVRANVVVNCVGKDWNKYGPMEDANVRFAQRLAAVCSQVGIERLVHLSVINAAEDHPSEFHRTKAVSEQAMLQEYPSVTILRLAEVFGYEDRLLNFFAKCIRVWQRCPLILRGAAHIQPVYVGDIGIAVAQVLEESGTEGKTYELAGPQVYSVNDFCQYIANAIEEPFKIFPMLPIVGRALGWTNEHLTFKPTFTYDRAIRFQYDNVKSPHTLGFKELDIKPDPLENEGSIFLAKWNRRNSRFLFTY